MTAPAHPIRYAIWADRFTNPRNPLWLRVVAFAEAHADDHGRCELPRQQLHHAIDPTIHGSNLSRAIRTAEAKGWLAPGSNARCLVLARAHDHGKVHAALLANRKSA